jgi:hypothetical protein
MSGWWSERGQVRGGCAAGDERKKIEDGYGSLAEGERGLVNGISEY